MTPPRPPSSPNGEPSSDVAPRGRPRDPERSRAILDAARALLHEGGWDGLTFEAVASRAGVGRPTVYRRWPTKGHLAAELLAMTMAESDERGGVLDVPLPDTGSLRGDLVMLGRLLIQQFAHLEREGIQPGVLAQMALDPELASQVRNDVLIPDRARVAVVVRRAIQRGEARSDLDPDLVMDLVGGMVVYLTYIVNERPDDHQLERIVDLVVGGSLA